MNISVISTVVNSAEVNKHAGSAEKLCLDQLWQGQSTLVFEEKQTTPHSFPHLHVIWFTCVYFLCQHKKNWAHWNQAGCCVAVGQKWKEISSHSNSGKSWQVFLQQSACLVLHRFGVTFEKYVSMEQTGLARDVSCLCNIQILDNHVISYMPPEQFEKHPTYRGRWHRKKPGPWGALVVGALSCDPFKVRTHPQQLPIVDVVLTGPRSVCCTGHDFHHKAG